VPADHLRAGAVKARRPRVRAGGAKRSALHGAEHRCNIVVVMADGVDLTRVVITSRRPRVDIERNARGTIFQESSRPAARAECDLVAGNIFRSNGTGFSGRSRSQSSASDTANTRRFSPPNMLCLTTEATVTAMA
jgi:hypothetical protein